jgi:hypothetical protein
LWLHLKVRACAAEHKIALYNVEGLQYTANATWTSRKSHNRGNACAPGSSVYPMKGSNSKECISHDHGDGRATCFITQFACTPASIAFSIPQGVWKKMSLRTLSSTCKHGYLLTVCTAMNLCAAKALTAAMSTSMGLEHVCPRTVAGRSSSANDVMPFPQTFQQRACGAQCAQCVHVHVDYAV